ncbi:MAG: sulfatase-like hydrolase/transferase [Gemmatimonadales bacterium]
MPQPTSSDARPPRPWADTVAVVSSGIAVSIFAGIIEAAIRRFGVPGIERLADVGNAFFWILPVGLALVNLPIVVVVAASHRLWPAAVTEARAAMVSTLLPSVSVSLAVLTTRIAEPVHAILALGIATMVGRAVAARPGGFRRLLRVAVPILLVAPPVALAMVLVSRARAARLTAAVPDRGAPNVLLVVWDTVRRPSLSLYGHDRPTSPQLTKRAAGGVVFEAAYSTAPWTLPSHASMFTGLHMQDLSTTWTAPLDRSRVVVAEIFSRAGYRTAGITANLMATHRPTGLARGFQHYEDSRIGRRPREYIGQLSLSQRLRRHQPFQRWSTFQGTWKDAEEISRSFLRWLAQSPPDRPFFAFLNYFDAHQPYRSPPEFRARFQGRGVQDRYDAGIAYVDAELDRLLTELERQGLLANTIVVVTSDHGEEFGEHGFEGHGESLHAQVLSVPLVVIAPGRVPAGIRLPQVTSTRHVGPTLVALAGLDSTFGRLGGESLARFWTDSASARDTALAGAHEGVNQLAETQISGGPATAIIDDRYHYIRTGRGREFLFGVADDPGQRHDLIGVDSLKPVIERTRRHLSTRLGEAWIQGPGAPASRAP